MLGFQQPDFHGEIRAELDRLRDNDLVRVIDALAVRKDADGEVEILHESQLSSDQQAAFGALVGGLIGLGATGDEGFEVGAERGGVFDEEEAWDVLAEIPEDTRRAAGAAGAPLGDRAARRHRPRRRVPAGVGVHQPPWTWSRSDWSRPRRPRRWSRLTAVPSDRPQRQRRDKDARTESKRSAPHRGPYSDRSRCRSCANGRASCGRRTAGRVSRRY